MTYIFSFGIIHMIRKRGKGMKLEIDIPEEMLEKEILDAVISVNTNNKTIKKVHIEPRVDDNKKVLDKMLVL